MKQERESILKNERGIALIVAMVMLLLLTMIGIFALNTSSTELHIVGNYRNTETAFFAADAGVAFGQTSAMIYNTLILGGAVPVTSWPNASSPNGTVSVSSNSADVGVVWVASSSIVPAKIAAVTDPDAVKVINHFVGTVTGHGPNNAAVTIESEFVRLY